MKTILVLVHGDEGQTSRVMAARTITKAFDAHLVCLHETVIPEFAGDYALHGGVPLCLEEEEREKANGRRVREQFERERIDHEWIDVTGFASQALQEKLPLIDLVISSCRLSDARSPDMTRVAEDLLRHGRKPLLLAPPGAAEFHIGGTAAVAWDGSPGSEAGLREAVPFLQKAHRVALLHVAERPPKVSCADACRYLSRYGVTADPVELETAGRTVAEALIDAVVEREAAILVAGAFDRIHVLDLLFGSTTRALIADSPVPLFLAH